MSVPEVPDHCQVLVVGGGPGGSTAAHLLKRDGHEVTLLERATFPRYHIGESLQPSVLAVLDRLALRDPLLERGFVKKYGIYNEWGGQTWGFEFASIPNHEAHSFHVIRSEFDQMLLEAARASGVNVFEGAEVVALDWDGDRPVAARWRSVANGDRSERTISFDRLIDASGKAGLVSTRYLKNRRFNEGFQNVAIWCYWKDTQPLNTGPVGAIAIATVGNGWLWFIPLHDGTLSVGLVVHRDEFKRRRKSNDDLLELYLDAIAECPLGRRLTKGAERISETRVEQDYSYAANSFAGPGYFVVGDAACFVDPLLATGVHLAMYSALLAAAATASLARGELPEPEVVAFYDRSYRESYLRTLVMVASFYQLVDDRESVFWKAQQLANEDFSGGPDNSAFISIVAGREDILNSADPARALVHHVRSVQRHMFDFMSHPERLERLAAMSPAELSELMGKGAELQSYADGRVSLHDREVRSLFIAPAPELGLQRAPAAPPAASSQRTA
jgi:flavin-dependent dehydrogenase